MRKIKFGDHPKKLIMAQLQIHTQVELRAACGPGRQIKHETLECRALNYSHLQSNDNGLHVYMPDTSKPHFNGSFQLFFFLFILGKELVQLDSPLKY